MVSLLKEKLRFLEDRKKGTYKWDYGNGLIVAGSYQARGCACLAAYSALRSGLGKVFLASVKEVVNSCSFLVPEALFIPVDKLVDLPSKVDFSRINTLAIGPGIGLDTETEEMLGYMLFSADSYGIPVVLDADALILMKNNVYRFKNRIITPNIREFASLTGESLEDIERDSEALALKYAKKWETIIVLKVGDGIVASHTGEVFVNNTGNPGMATAGMGDVLTGMIASFVCGLKDPFLGSSLAVFLHGLAGDMALKKASHISILARDVIENIGDAIREALK